MAIILKLFSYRKWVVIEKRKSTIIIIIIFIIIIIIIITNINSGFIYKSNGSSPCKLKKIQIKGQKTIENYQNELEIS